MKNNDNNDVKNVSGEKKMNMEDREKKNEIIRIIMRNGEKVDDKEREEKKYMNVD
jgi:hypothetical protein